MVNIILKIAENKYGKQLVFKIQISDICKCKALTLLFTINPSWTSVKETPCEANKITSSRLS